MRIAAFHIYRLGGEYRLWLENETHGIETAFIPFLGSFTSAFSIAFRSLLGQSGTVACADGPIPLDTLTVERMSEVAYPLTYRLIAGSGPYRYEATSDDVGEHVLLMVEGAMKFFAFKYKLITLEPELCMNRERAAQGGVLTREDG